MARINIMSYNKYNARKTPCNYGHMHDSVKEADRCNELHILEKAGKIRHLQIQTEYELIPAVKYKSPMKNERAIKYKADFVYYDTELKKTVIEDCKGKRTKEYIIKRKLIKQMYCNDTETIFIET